MKIKIYLSILMILLFTGCETANKSIEQNIPEDLPESWSSDISVTQLPVTSGILDYISDPELEKIIIEALENNPGIKASEHRLKAAGYLVKSGRADMLPRAEVKYSQERNNQKINDETGKKEIGNSSNIEGGISWELDIWGRLSDINSANRHSLESEKENYIQSRDLLAVRVIQTWIENISLKAAYDMENERISVLRKIESIIIERYREGLSSHEDLSAAKARTFTAVADLSVQKEALDKSVRRLEILLGRYPEGNLSSSDSLPEIAIPFAELPVDVLLKRPDVKSASSKVEEARKRLSASKKAMLPSLTLSGQVFKTGTDLESLDNARTGWSILGSVFQPLFEGGRLKNNSMSRKSELDASIYDLYNTILTAMGEVENYYELEKELTVQINALSEASVQSEKSSSYYENRYRQGLESIQILLNTKEQEMLTKMRLSRTKGERLSNRISLILALGIGIDPENSLQEDA